MIEPDSIINNNWFADSELLRTGKEIYIEMSRAEMELEYETKQKELGLKGNNLSRNLSKMTDS